MTYLLGSIFPLPRLQPAMRSCTIATHRWLLCKDCCDWLNYIYRLPHWRPKQHSPNQQRDLESHYFIDQQQSCILKVQLSAFQIHVVIDLKNFPPNMHVSRNSLRRSDAYMRQLTNHYDNGFSPGRYQALIGTSAETVNWILGDKLQCNLNRNVYTCIQ